MACTWCKIIKVSARPGATWRIFTVPNNGTQLSFIIQINTMLGLGQGCRMSGFSPTVDPKSRQFDWRRNWWTANIERRMNVVRLFKKGRAKPPARRGCDAYASESETTLRYSTFDIRFGWARRRLRFVFFNFNFVLLRKEGCIYQTIKISKL